ncbi:MAG: hypothetical protein ACI8UO_001413 [Verrucomicrobiales bacterium]|jgi:hypothetical protein
MALLDTSRLTLKLGAYGTAPATALGDPLLLPRVQAYRRQLSGRMIGLDKASIAKKLPKGDYHVSRKVDGEFTVLVVRGKEAFTINPGGTIRAGLPLVDEAKTQLKGIRDALIVGELYVDRPDGKRPRVHDVVRVARKPESQDDVDTLKLAVFDILDLNGKEFGTDYAETWKKIEELFGGGDRVHPVETIEGNDKAVRDRFDSWVEEEGGEGVVARSESSGWFKIKPRHTLDVAVIGFAEGTDDRAGMIHDLLLAIMRKDGNFQVLGRVGGGFSDEDRKNLLSDFSDIAAESEYAEVNSDRVAYQMVRPEKVIEISCLDLVSETTRGGSIDRMVLNWNANERKWETVRRLPLVSVISPQFIRIRDDKKVNVDDVRLQQLLDLVEITLADKTANELELPKSELLRRKAAVKTLKGRKMVRKLLMWKTNKEESPEFPAFVVYLTDFSPNRKDPLQREIRVSSSQEQITELWDALEKKFFVKGWEEVSG